MTKARRYRIQAVSELTGVGTASLRAWERRYGVPRPARTRGSYRLYAEHDISLIRRMRSLIEAGLSASEAARLTLEAGELGAAEPEGGHGFAPVVERLVELTRVMHVSELERAVRSALALGDAFTVVADIYVPTLRKVGDEWHAGRLSTAHEHAASEVVTAVVRDLLWHVQPAQPRARALLACFADELHTLPLYAAAFAFAQQGVGAHLLGARTDPDALAVAVRHLKPELVGLSLTVAPLRATLASLLDGYARAAQGVPWLVGGGAASQIAELVQSRGGRVVTSDREAFARAIEDALRTGGPTPRQEGP